MDDDDLDTTPHLQCDVELDFEGPNIATLNKWAADALRKVADLIEKGHVEDGHHPINDNVGKEVGTLYIDYYGYEEF